MTQLLHSKNLKKLPNVKLLLLKAAFKRSEVTSQDLSNYQLPHTQFYVEQFDIEEASVKSFHDVVLWDIQSQYIHPCYLHTLGFSLHLKLLLLADCPFPLIGLIHLSNQIKQIRPVMVGEKLSMIGAFGALTSHAKGWSFSINIKVYCAGELIWASQSQYLFITRNVSLPRKAGVADMQQTFVDDQLSVSHYLRANLGRQYAWVSGDFNPIHLATITAKMFGLKRHIIHGMWTKAYCISLMQNQGKLDSCKAFEVNVKFKQPLPLPNKITLHTHANEPTNSDDCRVFNVHSSDQVPIRLHLVGDLRPI